MASKQLLGLEDCSFCCSAGYYGRMLGGPVEWQIFPETQGPDASGTGN